MLCANMIQLYPLGRALCVLLVLLFAGVQANAQSCTLTANNEVVVALGNPAIDTITFDQVLEGNPSCAATLVVTVFNRNFSARPAPVVTCADVGKRLIVRVADSQSGAQVFSAVIIVDNLRPTVTAQSPVMLSCTDDLSEAALASTLTASDNCTAAAALQFIVTAQQSSVGCTGGVAQTLTRTIRVVDASGNISAPVTQTIIVERESILDVQVPANDTILTSVTGLCPGAQTIPVEAPTVNGAPISASCKLLFTTRDIEIALCNGGRKIIRTYTIIDCCTNEIRDAQQLIVIKDDVAPGFTALPDTLLAVPLGQNCRFQALFPPIQASDDCGTDVTVRIQTPFGAVNGNGGLLNFEFGIDDTPFSATYEIRDACGNLATQTVVILAVDNLPPVARCDEITTIGLNSNSTSVAALVFDDGSSDNCCFDGFLVRRDMTQAFADSVTFTCADVGDTVMVELQVIDCEGNTNSCMVSAIIEDNIPPVITGLPPFTADCTVRPVDPAVSGVPTISQNCGNFVLQPGFVDVDVSNNNCGLGETQRTFFFVNSFDDTLVSVQTIFYVDTSTVVLPTLPLPELRLDCNSILDASTLNPPVIATACQDFLLNISLQFFAGTCEQKVIATYSYTSTCLSTQTIVIEQVIILEDNTAPSFADASLLAETRFQCPADLPSPFIKVSPQATDDCNNPVVVEVSDTTTPTSSSPGCGNFTREVRYVAEDGCGNQSQDTFVVRTVVADTTRPTASLPVNDVELSCAAELPAAQATAAYLSASDNCGGMLDILVSTTAGASNTTCSGSFSRVYVVTDPCGNSLSLEQRFTYEDETGPAFEPILDTLTFECAADFPVATLADLTLTSSACMSSLTLDGVEDVGDTTLCNTPITRIYTVSDACGNAGTVSRTLQINNVTPPQLSFRLDTFRFSTEFMQCQRTFLNLRPGISYTCADDYFSSSNNSPFAINQDTFQAAGTYPPGTYDLQFAVTDVCGNTGRDSIVLIIMDDEDPSINCEPFEVVINPLGSGRLDTNKLLAALAATDNCTAASNIERVFTLLPQLTYDCDDYFDFIDGEEFNFNVEFTDEAGNTAPCGSNIVIEGADACGFALSAGRDVIGNIYLPLYPAQDVVGTAKLNTGTGSRTTAISPGGAYGFLDVGNQDVSVQVDLAMEALGGITTHDILLAGRHILGTDKLDNPLRLLAADVNCNGRISSYDLTLMRRVILGIDAAFPAGTQTIAVAAGHQFADADNPWLDESVWRANLPGGNADVLAYNLDVVRLGDVNGSGFLQPRSSVGLAIADRAVEAGERVVLPVHMRSPTALAGMQLAFAAEGELFVAKADANIDILTHVKDGLHRVSITSEVLTGEAVLVLEFVAAREGMLSELISLSTAGFTNEAYTSSGLVPMGLYLDWQLGEPVGETALTATPNPFDDYLQVQVRLAEGAAYTLTCHDLTGRSFAERRITTAQSGWQSLRLATQEWPTGTYFITISGPEGRFTERVLLQR